MEAGGIHPAGSGRALRLDPFALPVRFRANDAGADGQVRHIELDREHVILRRAVRGMAMKIRMPVSAFRGVALQLHDAPGEPALAVVLDHSDGALCVPLLVARDDNEAIASWKAWGRVLGLPLLVAEPGGACREITKRLGALSIAEVAQRRRRRSALKRRRPSILRRRRMGRSIADASVHRGEREIIARN
jgi:hypothetical protein